MDERQLQQPAAWVRRHRAITLALGAAVIAACAGFLAAGSTDRQAAAAATAPAAGPAAHFAVLRSPPAQDASAGLFAKAPSLVKGYDLDLSSARAAGGAGREVWVASGPDTVCVLAAGAFHDGFGGSCGAADGVGDTGIWSTGHPAPSQTADGQFAQHTTDVVGLLPDGIDAITITLADATTKELAVTDNVVAATFPELVTTARFVTASGQSHVARLAGPDGY
jgi:hypothetical protein